jgi:uncharacterized membrane protein
MKMAGGILALSVAVAVAIFAVYALTADEGSERGEAPPAAAAAGENIEIPVAELNDGSARFYTYDAAGAEVRYFVLKSSDGELRAAFDACDVCYAQKRGYLQDGDEMVCNNCGRRFPSKDVNVVEGGCNPSPLDRRVEGDNLVIAAADLQAGARYFQ